MARSVPLWVGSTDDAKVPPRIRLRIYVREDGKCWLSGRKIQPGEKWELEHKIALCNGGRHAEDNLAPALVAPHKIKTRQDRAIKKRTDKIRKAHIGVKKPRTITRWRLFDGSIVTASRER